ncbi:TFIIB-type zinc ribbon-containing protein [Saccharolobus caldissimus]|uniref:TFIIB-type domain-containing protein n=1 Tax=Saccharolobus caldissimus TaxID=1702097 RepID=A0AAQ4CMY8_9CREN|nr:TFIIB-type zinc ribbon-containing protein [Saccharolobus caldissimus]BDB97169.1 hypothetical protein SACC_01860 [Saccharolobus caldissimus]
MTLSCPVCGSSEIIWNEKKGEVVCGVCGTVIDIIYSYSMTESDTEEIVIDNKYYKDEIKIKESRVKEFMKNENNIRKINEYEIILNSMLLDKKYRIIYKILNEEGILGGIKAKTKVGLLIYFRYAYNNEYLKILEKLGIKKALIRKNIRKIGNKKMRRVLDKIIEEIEQI